MNLSNAGMIITIIAIFVGGVAGFYESFRIPNIEDKYEIELTMLNSKIENLQKELEHSKSQESSHLAGLLENKKTEINRLNLELDNIKLLLKTNGELVDNLKEKLFSLNSENDGLKNQLNKVTMDKRELVKQLDLLKNENVDLNKKLSNLKETQIGLIKRQKEIKSNKIKVSSEPSSFVMPSDDEIISKLSLGHFTDVNSAIGDKGFFTDSNYDTFFFVIIESPSSIETCHACKVTLSLALFDNPKDLNLKKYLINIAETSGFST